VADGSELVLAGRAEVVERGFAVRVRVLDTSGAVVGERELRSGSQPCEALTPSLLLVLAMSVDPQTSGLPAAVIDQLQPDAPDTNSAAASGSQTERQRESRPAPKPALRRVEPAPGQRQLASSAPLDTEGLRILWLTLLSLGLQPGVSPGIGAAGEAGKAQGWSGWLTATAFLPSAVQVEGPRVLADNVSFNTAHATLSGCRHLGGTGALYGTACAGALAGVRWASASALETRSAAPRAYYGPVLTLKATYFSRARWLLEAGAAATASLVRDRFVYVEHTGGERLLYEPARFSGWAYVGFGGLL
jgi:hypothetical protein